MAMLSLICCLLALSSSAFARSHYGGYSSVPSTPMILPTAARELPIEQKPLTLPTQYGGYGQPQPTVVRDLPIEQKPVTLPTQYGGYGQQQPETFIQKTISLPVQQVIPSPQQLLLQQQQELLAKNEAAKIITEADILCRGQLPETVLPLHHGHRFVVCLEDGKGWEQHCPKGLLWHPETRRCERKLGPLESPCASQPCLNGGKCVQTDVSSYRCECPTGLDGTICELDARVCHTQQPCGQAPGTRCQSFRFGAALQYVCIHQHGHAYGFNAQQIQGNPCQGIDGARSLLISDKGFIMCDGERMSVESCPGGTLWDDNNKACVWPDMQEFVTLPVVEKKSFDLQRPLQTSSYSYGQPQTPFIEKPKVFTRVIPQQVQEYGAQIQPMKHFESRELPSQQIEFPKQQSYGQQPQTPFIETPKVFTRVIPQQVQEYGAQIQPMKHFESRELPSQQIEFPKQQSYGQQPQTPFIETPKILPRVFPQQVQEYGAQVQPMKHFESRELPSQQIEVPKQQSYGQQPVPQTWTQPIVPRFRELRPLPVQSGY